MIVVRFVFAFGLIPALAGQVSGQLGRAKEVADARLLEYLTDGGSLPRQYSYRLDAAFILAPTKENVFWEQRRQWRVDVHKDQMIRRDERYEEIKDAAADGDPDFRVFTKRWSIRDRKFVSVGSAEPGAPGLSSDWAEVEGFSPTPYSFDLSPFHLPFLNRAMLASTRESNSPEKLFSQLAIIDAKFNDSGIWARWGKKDTAGGFWYTVEMQFDRRVLYRPVAFEWRVFRDTDFNNENPPEEDDEQGGVLYSKNRLEWIRMSHDGEYYWLPKTALCAIRTAKGVQDCRFDYEWRVGENFEVDDLIVPEAIVSILESEMQSNVEPVKAN